MMNISTYWENFDKLVSKGYIISTESVFKELQDLKYENDDVFNWAGLNKNIFKIYDNRLEEQVIFIKKKNFLTGIFREMKMKYGLIEILL